jgi:hypothetical protein
MPRAAHAGQNHARERADKQQRREKEAIAPHPLAQPEWLSVA